MLKEGIDVYVPLVDDDAIDAAGKKRGLPLKREICSKLKIFN
jgi:hypothetical protein